MFPVGMPDEGTFDWLDNFFLKKHPEFVEHVGGRNFRRPAHAADPLDRKRLRERLLTENRFLSSFARRDTSEKSRAAVL